MSINNFFKKFRLDKEYRDAIHTASIIGLHMVSHTFVGFVFGYLLDRWLKTYPWLTLIFLVLGVAAGFMAVYRDTKKLAKDFKYKQDDDDDQQPS